jgi:hypothetical protein
MKRLLPALVLIVVAFAACKKENAARTGEIIIEPVLPKLISSDTLTAGGQLGINIGQTSAEIYSKIQAMRVEKNISAMGIVNNVYTDLAQLENKIPLYTSVYLDETKGTGTGIQINFESDKVKSIFTNDGVQLNSWPGFTDTENTVAVGNDIGAVYQKLVNIKKQGAYTKKFERLSVFFKDVNKAYDPQMSASPQWYFVSKVTDKRYNWVALNFTAGKLSSIYFTLYENR